MEKLSQKQIKILDFLKQFIKEKGYAPSVREICTAVGLKSTSTAHGYLERLEMKGFIKKDPQRPRTLIICDDSSDMLYENLISVPVVGRVAAGSPILAIENIDEYMTLPYSFVRSENVFILNVKGDSMTDAGILDGDKILARKQNWAQNGDIVIAMIEDEATVKRYYMEEDRIRLQPANDLYEPIYAREVNVLGKVIGLMRSLR
jgi:repressor LexA